jgi:hypothetical protein
MLSPVGSCSLQLLKWNHALQLLPLDMAINDI